MQRPVPPSTSATRWCPAIRADCSSRRHRAAGRRRVDRRVPRRRVRVPAPRRVPRALGMSGTYDLRRFFDGAGGRPDYFASRRRSHFVPDARPGRHLDVLRTRFIVLASGEGSATRTSVSRGAWPTCSAAWASPTGSTRGGRSGTTTGHCGGRCCRSYLDELVEGDDDARGPHRPPGSATDRRTRDSWLDARATCARSSACSPETCSRPACARIGAEQEMFLVDALVAAGAAARWRCSPRSTDQHYTTELGAFNLELNCDPQLFSGDGLVAHGRPARRAAGARRTPRPTAAGLHIVLTGILPTIRKRDLVARQHGAEPAVPGAQRRVARPARRGLLRAAHQGRSTSCVVRQDSVMVEACNASFQVHLQVDAGRVRQRLQHRAGCSPARCSRRRPTRRCCSASGCGPRRASRCSSSRSTPAARPRTCASAQARVTFGTRWVQRVGRRDLPARTSRASARARRPTLDEDPMAELEPRRGAAPQGAAAAQRHGLSLEPRLLRHLGDGQAAPAHREPRAAVGAEHRRRDRERRALARVDEGAPTRVPRDQPDDAVRAGAGELLRRPPARALVDAGVARRRRASGRRASRSTCCCRWPPRGWPRWASTTPTSSATSASSSAGCAPGTPGRGGPSCRSPRCSTRARVGSASTA